jgi:hypothetical protein
MDKDNFDDMGEFEFPKDFLDEFFKNILNNRNAGLPNLAGFGNSLHNSLNFNSLENSQNSARILCKECEEKIRNNQDDRTKSLGDRVKVWDGSTFIHENGRKKYIVEDDIESIKYFIVVATEEEYFITSPEPFCEKRQQDLLIIDPISEEKYRASSDHVFLCDKNGMRIPDKK